MCSFGVHPMHCIWVEVRTVLTISKNHGCVWWHTLQWRHNGRDSVWNHQPHDCLLNRLFWRRSKKTSKLRVTGLCVGNSPGTGEFPHKWPVTRKMFPFDDVTMISDCYGLTYLGHFCQITLITNLKYVVQYSDQRWSHWKCGYCHEFNPCMVTEQIATICKWQFQNQFGMKIVFFFTNFKIIPESPLDNSQH